MFFTLFIIVSIPFFCIVTLNDGLELVSKALPAETRSVFMGLTGRYQVIKVFLVFLGYQKLLIKFLILVPNE